MIDLVIEEQQDYFDKILLDAPCSSERHLLEKKEIIKNWSAKRTKRLSQNQFTMICSAWMALKEGGELVYSTCSISPLENDEIIKKLFNKKGSSVELVDLHFDIGERTSHGWIFLPDQCTLGPMYVAKLRKLR